MAEVKQDRTESPQATSKAASNARDPSRPRRKKARRACMACQRAHLTCGDERPCERCIKRGLTETCQDGVRKKAKYLHDAPDSALQPTIAGRAFPHTNGHQQRPLPVQEIGPVSLPQQAGFYAQAPPTTTYYSQNQTQPAVPVSAQDLSPGTFHNAPPFNPTTHNNITSIPNVAPGPQTVNQFSQAMFDPSDPALFNFDISSLNFGNQYGALEMGVLNHMSSAAGAADQNTDDRNLLNMNQAAGLFNHQHMGFGENIGYDHTNGLAADWHNHHARHGSLQQLQTSKHAPTQGGMDGQRHDSLPHAFAIATGPGSFSSPSPGSTDVNGGQEAENTLAGTNFFPHHGQHHSHHRSPRMNRTHQENRISSTALQPIRGNAIPKRRRDTSWVYRNVKKPYDYVTAFHRMVKIVQRQYPEPSVRKIMQSMGLYRPVLITMGGRLQKEDLIYQEQALQLSLIQIEDSFSEVGVPSIVCRRSGEVVWMNKEFHILTGWSRDVLLGNEPNLNINTGSRKGVGSGFSTGASTTPVIAGQQDPTTNGAAKNNPVLIIELLDERAAVEWFEDFAQCAFLDSQPSCRRRVNFLRYMTKRDVDQQEQAGPHQDSNVQLNGGPVHPEGNMDQLSKDGVVDCMIQWHVKRDTFDMPMLICMHAMPVLDAQPGRLQPMPE